MEIQEQVLKAAYQIVGYIVAAIIVFMIVIVSMGVWVLMLCGMIVDGFVRAKALRTKSERPKLRVVESVKL